MKPTIHLAPRNPNAPGHRGFGFVEVEGATTPDETIAALDGLLVRGRPVLRGRAQERGR
jgi:hypothetical protein